MRLVLLIAISLPVALGGMITLNGEFSDAVIYGANGILSGNITIAPINTMVDEVTIIDCRINAGNTTINAKEQRAFITLGDGEIAMDTEDGLSIIAGIKDREIELNGVIEVDGLRLSSDNLTLSLRAEGCTFTGSCRKIEFGDADPLRITMDGADLLSGVWMDGSYKQARSALIENENINIVEYSAPAADRFLSLAAKLWIAALILLLFSAHISRRFETDRKAGRVAKIIALLVIICSLYFFDRSFSSKFVTTRSLESALIECFAFCAIFVLLSLPLHYCTRSLAKIFGFRRSAPAIGLIIAFSFLAYLSIHTEAIEAITISLGRELIGRLPLLV
ncbi:MAG: hypothetical protein SVE93_08440 [Candidatus Thermoplasmatota archaeon]|nr:hypothetical protein [Candidatus Thermoplasmatota archaeon]